MAARGMLAADGEAPYCWFPRRRIAGDRRRVGLRFTSRLPRTWLDRRPQHKDRPALGGRSQRPLGRDRSRLREAQGWRDRDIFERAHSNCKAGDLDYPNCLRARGRPCRQRPGRYFGTPGGNLTGLSAQNVELTGKRFELLREIVPGLRRLAVMFNGNNPTSMIEIDIVRTAASPLGIEVSPSEIWRVEDIAPAIATTATQADALSVVGEPLTFTHRLRISTLALAARLPTTYPTRGYSGNLFGTGSRRSRRIDELWSQPHRCVSSGRHFHRPRPQGCQARGIASRAVDQVQTGHQRADRSNAWPHRARQATRHRRRGHRMCAPGWMKRGGPWFQSVFGSS